MAKERDFKACEALESMETGGVMYVSTEDLLTVILDNREKAQKLLHKDGDLFDGAKDGLKCMAGADFSELQFSGNLTKKETAKILAAIELGKRMARSTSENLAHICSPGDGAQYLMSRLRHETHETFFVILLNTKNRVIRIKKIAEGSLTSAVVHPREVFAPAVAAHAACILVAHNHPSGDPYPSTEDRKLTNALDDAGNIMGIPLALQ